MTSGLLVEYLDVDSLNAPTGGREAAPPELPCQNSHNSTGAELTGSQKKAAYALQKNVQSLCEKYGVEHLGFLTLTFADNVQDLKEAQRRFNSFSTHVLKRYTEWICVVERQKSGRIHFHLLVVCEFNVREPAPGFRFVDHAAIKDKDYSSASARLKREWALLRRKCKEGKRNYRFGRSELLPVKSTAEAISRYLGKYISKHIAGRLPKDKGARLVRCSKGTNRCGRQFSFNSIGAYLWRHKLKLFAFGIGAQCADDLKRMFGPRWAYKLKSAIDYIKLPRYPTGEHYNRDNESSVAVPRDVVEVSDSSDKFERVQAVVRTIVNEGLRIWNKNAFRQYLSAMRRAL